MLAIYLSMPINYRNSLRLQSEDTQVKQKPRLERLFLPTLHTYTWNKNYVSNSINVYIYYYYLYCVIKICY